MGARRILEIGTLGGYSGIWLARALPAGGRLTTLELDAAHAEVARKNFVRAGLADTVEIRLGPALQTLPTLRGPFDLIFIDADKPGYTEVFRLGGPAGAPRALHRRRQRRPQRRRCRRRLDRRQCPGDSTVQCRRRGRAARDDDRDSDGRGEGLRRLRGHPRGGAMNTCEPDARRHFSSRPVRGSAVSTTSDVPRSVRA